MPIQQGPQAVPCSQLDEAGPIQTGLKQLHDPLALGGLERKSGAAGPFVDVSHHFGTISGEAVEVEIGKVSGGTIQIKSSVDTVEKGGKFTGLKIDSLG